MQQQAPDASRTIKSPPSETDKLYSKVIWRLIPFLCLCYVFSYLDRINVSFAKLQMSSELGFSDTVYGFGAGIFFIAYFLFEVPSNMILLKVGPKRWIARIMISWGILTGIMAFTNSAMMFYVLRFLIGVSEAGFFPAIILYLSSWFPSNRRGQIIALFMSAIPLSGILGGVVSGWILDTFNNVGGFGGWRWLFMLESIPTIIIGIWVLFYLDDHLSKAKWLTPEERATLQANIDAEQGSKTHSSFGQMVSSRKVWLLASVFFCVCMGQFGLAFWMPSIIKATGVVSSSKVGLLSAIPWVFGIIAMILVGRHSDATGERRWHYAIAAFISALGLVFAGLWGGANTVLAVTGLTIMCMGLQCLPPIFWTFPTAMLSGVAAAAGIALINSIGNLAGFVSPYMVGWISDKTGSTDLGLFIISACLALGGLIVLIIGTNQPKPQSH